MIIKYEKHYKMLVENFLSNISQFDLSGIPAPHIPLIGELYENSKYKIAFFGMETKGWGNLAEFKNEFKNDPNNALKSLTEGFRELDFVHWTNNCNTTFFNYVLLFLAKFYKINDWKLFRSDENLQYILKTFIWGNTNSIERFEVSAKQNGVPWETWEAVKKNSKVFDTAKYVLELCRPDILIVMNWSESQKWLGNFHDVKKTIIDDHLFYLFVETTNTHVYWLAHPRWIAINGGFDKSMKLIFDDINRRNIHVDNNIIDELLLQNEFNRNSDKKNYIGALAQFLSSRDMKMSGMELAHHLNRNGFRTSYGTRYIGTRGTYKLIRNCYIHFQNNSKQDIADSIALSFVKENGEFAYK